MSNRSPTALADKLERWKHQIYYALPFDLSDDICAALRAKPTVTDAMVDIAANAYSTDVGIKRSSQQHKDRMRKALEAAFAEAAK